MDSIGVTPTQPTACLPEQGMQLRHPAEASMFALPALLGRDSDHESRNIWGSFMFILERLAPIGVRPGFGRLPAPAKVS